jgi:hypothetical protein
VVLSFDRAAAALEGDLTAYLNHQEKHGSMMVEFRYEHSPKALGKCGVWYVALPNRKTSHVPSVLCAHSPLAPTWQPQWQQHLG